MFCPQCGEENNPDVKICFNCEAKLAELNNNITSDIIHDQTKQKKVFKTAVIFNSIIATTIFLAVVFCTISFFVPILVRNAFVIVSISLFVIFFILNICKFTITLNIKKK